MRIFIVGANSFVGSRLRQMCGERAIEFSGVDVAGPFADGVSRVDLRDSALVDLIPRGATVVHLAAISRDSDCDASPASAMSINISGSTNIAQAAVAAKAKRVIFASSEWVYGRSPSTTELTEDLGPAWTDLQSLYAFSKAAGEQIMAVAADQVPVTALRFAIIYGPRATNWSAFEAMVASTAKGRVEVGSLATARRFVHVSDVCSGVLAAASDSARGMRTWNLAGPDLVSLGDVVRLTSEALGTEVEIVERDPSNPSVRNPTPDAMKRELGWFATTTSRAGVMDVLRFINAPSQ